MVVELNHYLTIDYSAYDVERWLISWIELYTFKALNKTKRSNMNILVVLVRKLLICSSRVVEIVTLLFLLTI